MSSLDDIGRALKGHKNSYGRWLCKCPAHNDKDPSLSLFAKDGRFLAYCHAGCDFKDVLAALKAMGLEPPGNLTCLRTDFRKENYAAKYGKEHIADEVDEHKIYLFLNGCVARWGDQPFTVAKILEACRGDQRWTEIVLDICPQKNRQRLGYFLKRLRTGRLYKGFTITPAGRDQVSKALQYRAVRVE